jgi:hypothetical protein
MSTVNKSKTFAASKKPQVAYKDVRAYHERVTRQGTYLPAFNSKFVNLSTIEEIVENKIFRLPTEKVVFRICCTPPSTLILVKKVNAYLKPFNLASGIDLEK